MRHNGIVLLSDNLLELAPQIPKEDHDRFHGWFDHERANTLQQAKKIIDGDNYRDFIYDRGTGSVIFNIIAHPVYIGKLEAFYRACVDKQGSTEEFWDEVDKSLGKRSYCESYLGKMRGFYASSVGSGIEIQTGFKLTAQEKLVFRGLVFSETDYND